MKSAVEWFAIELRQCLEKNGKIELTPTLLDKLEEQAKEMEENRATEYAKYFRRCDRIGVLPSFFNYWKKSFEEPFKQQEQ